MIYILVYIYIHTHTHPYIHTSSISFFLLTYHTLHFLAEDHMPSSHIHYGGFWFRLYIISNRVLLLSSSIVCTMDHHNPNRHNDSPCILVYLVVFVNASSFFSYILISQALLQSDLFLGYGPHTCFSLHTTIKSCRSIRILLFNGYSGSIKKNKV